MNVIRVIGRRLAIGLVTIWAVLSGVFVLFTQTEDWHLSAILARTARSPTTDEEDVAQAREAYLAERNLDRPALELYADWMERMFTFQWGESFDTGREVFPMVMAATRRTAMYVGPAVVLAALLGLVVGLVTAIYSDKRGEGATRSGAYVGLSVPNFWIGAVILTIATGVGMVYRPVFLAGMRIPEITVVELPFLYEYVLPTVLVATTLLAAIVSYARAYSLQYYSDDLTKLVRAKGGSRRDVARHVVRNAAVPLVSLLVAETLALIALSVFVIEAVFGIGGLGSLVYNAVWIRDLPVLMGCSMVIVAVGVLGTLLQDLLYWWIDPRVDLDSL